MKASLLLASVASVMSTAAIAQGALLAKLDTSKPTQVVPLDPMLAEVSGLAPAGPRSVFAHNDEYAIIHEVDITNGVIIRSFALGKPTVAGDFEGIAVWGKFIYLITSDGMLYEAPIKKHRERARYVVYDTGLRGLCEIEGMAVDLSANAFLFSCKSSELDKQNKRLTIYKWSFADRLEEQRPWLEVPLADIIPEDGKRQNFKPSELQRDPKTGDLFVMDASLGALVEITPQGSSVAYRRLTKRSHPQPEGLALMSDGSIVIGDETRGASAKLSIYRPGR
jgi:uncharacterized protein YjiK